MLTVFVISDAAKWPNIVGRQCCALY